MTGFAATLVPALVAFLIGLLVAWFIWGRASDEQY